MKIAKAGDYITKIVKNEFYQDNSDILEKRYELVNKKGASQKCSFFVP